MDHFIGIDFGTTNSVLARADKNGHVTAARYKFGMADTETFRTVLCFWFESHKLHRAAGPWAIDEYLKDTENSRFIQSIKTYLASQTFTDTRIYNQKFELQDLIAPFLKMMWDHAAPSLSLPDDKKQCAIVAGRPVNFAGTNPDNIFAEGRLNESYIRAGFSAPRFAFEPQGAAYYYAAQLQADARILVADFGGGTSDFSVMDCVYKNGTTTLTPVAHSGIGIAGDALDYRIIDHLVSPAIGKNSRYKSFDKWLDMPTGYYRAFASWHLLSLINTPKILREIEDIARTSDAPDQVLKLEKMIRCEMGYALYRAVAKAKADLSSNDTTEFVFENEGISIRRKLTRAHFEEWIRDDISRINKTIDDVLTRSDLKENNITRVFMTGGTSYVPAIRTMIAERFGIDKIAAGNEFTSVGAGLALMAREHAP